MQRPLPGVQKLFYPAVAIRTLKRHAAEQEAVLASTELSDEEQRA